MKPLLFALAVVLLLVAPAAADDPPNLALAPDAMVVQIRLGALRSLAAKYVKLRIDLDDALRQRDAAMARLVAAGKCL